MNNSAITWSDPYRIADAYFAKRRALDGPALYFLGEILALRNRGTEELTEIHKAKLGYPGQRIIQEGAE